MNEKLCLVCFESIDARARKCHHCREIQSKASAWVHHPAALTTFMILLALLLVWVFYSLLRSREDPSFVGKLTVGTATLRLSTAAGQPQVSCLAPLKNGDTIHWGRISLQAEFLDAQGQVIDVHNNQGTFAIFPGLTATGRASGPATAQAENYAGCRITILDARVGH